MERKALFVAVIPAFNESKSIATVIKGIINLLDVVVVDDGSTDETGAIVKANGAFLVSHTRNLGYDKAIESGLKWAISNNYLFAITFDADGQHIPSSLYDFKKELLDGADLVIGIRDHTQRWSEKAFSVISTMLWGIRDPLCGMKGYNLRIFNPSEHLSSYKSIGTEILIRSLKSKLIVRQCLIPTANRTGSSRFGGFFSANAKILLSLLQGLLLTRSYYR